MTKENIQFKNLFIFHRSGFDDDEKCDVRRRVHVPIIFYDIFYFLDGILLLNHKTIEIIQVVR